jgi:hypothetical protein
MIRFTLLILLLNSFISGFSQDSMITDGPYIFYNGRQIIVESINNGQLMIDTLGRKNKRDQPIKVLLQSEPGVSFSVPLKSSLTNEPAVFPAAEKMFVLSDIEGTFQGLFTLLVKGGVIDERFNWTFGTGHLVICGDMFDRGDEVTACLWLLYKLEDEAKTKGGYVHVILGNHEMMNLYGDYRYVNTKYRSSVAILHKDYSKLYDNDSELGRWLRTKNIMEKIGDWLCLHGGVSEIINKSGLSLASLNETARPYYDKGDDDSLLVVAKVYPLFHPDAAPFWYRGYFEEPVAGMPQVDQTLRTFEVKHIIVGHTIVDSIQPRFDKKVIAIDVNYHQGNYEGLVIEKNNFYRMTKDGQKQQLN